MAGHVKYIEGRSKNGATIYQFDKAQQQHRVVCGCNKTFYLGHEKALRALRSPRHMLQCYECSCKVKAENARKANLLRYTTK